MGKNSRLETWLQYRIRVVISDTRYFVGTFFSYDRHMNIVLVDAEEFRKIKDKENGFKEIKRVIGIILIRGENIVSFTAEHGPINKKAINSVINKGIATGRGVALNSYVPMQNNFNPNLTNHMSNMPTGMTLNTSTTKSLASTINPNIRPPNAPLNAPINAPRPMIPFNMPINQPIPNVNNLPQRLQPQLPFPPNTKPPTE